MTRRRPVARAGFSLVEVLVATSILLASVLILAQLAATGRRHVDAASQKAIAVRLCQNKLARLLAGIDTIESDGEGPLEEDLDWLCRVRTWPTSRADLIQLEVGVRPIRNDMSLTKTDQRWFVLRRIVPQRLQARGGTDE